jgi:hypothetical protein
LGASQTCRNKAARQCRNVGTAGIDSSPRKLYNTMQILSPAEVGLSVAWCKSPKTFSQSSEYVVEFRLISAETGPGNISISNRVKTSVDNQREQAS